jgi:uncharacterized coiled-coil protein SlyX
MKDKKDILTRVGVLGLAVASLVALTSGYMVTLSFYWSNGNFSGVKPLGPLLITAGFLLFVIVVIVRKRVERKRKPNIEPTELDETVTAAKEGIQELEASRNAAVTRLKELESQSTQDKQEIDTLKQQIAEDDREIDKLREALIQVYKDLEIQRIQVENLKGSKDYFRISKLHANASFIISVIACFVGLGLLAVAAIFAIREQDFRVGIVPAIGGAVANFIAATVFWVHNKSAQQLNRYYDSLHEIEVFLSSVKVIEKISTPEKKDEAYAKILDELFNIQKIKAALPSKHTNPKDKEG